MITVLLLIAAVSILVWGFVRAKPYGTLGILAWLQTVVLMGPWLLFFGLSAAGVYLNLASILLLVVSSAAAYIYLGKRLRATGQTELAQERAEALISTEAADSTELPASSESQAAGVSEGPMGTTVNVSAVNASDALAKALSETDDSNAAAEKTDFEKKDADKPESLPPIPAEDLVAIEGIFGIDTFFRTKTVSYPEGAIFKGNLRGKPDETAQVLSRKLAEKLGDRYQSFLMIDPDDKPVVVVLPSSNGPKPTTVGHRVLAVALAIATIATCLETAGLLQSFDVIKCPSAYPKHYLSPKASQQFW